MASFIRLNEHLSNNRTLLITVAKEDIVSMERMEESLPSGKSIFLTKITLSFSGKNGKHETIKVMEPLHQIQLLMTRSRVAAY